MWRWSPRSGPLRRTHRHSTRQTYNSSTPTRTRRAPYTNLTFRREVYHDVSLAVTAYDNYDNRPESADASTNDIGYSLTLGWTF